LPREASRDYPLNQNELFFRPGVYVPTAHQTAADFVLEVDPAVFCELDESRRGDKNTNQWLRAVLEVRMPTAHQLFRNSRTEWGCIAGWQQLDV
jgi:hypothetical protein